MAIKCAIHYENGYAECNLTEVVIADNLEQAQAWGDEYLLDYATDYEYIINDAYVEAHGDDEDGGSEWDGTDFYESQEYETYYSNCVVRVEIITDENEEKYLGYEVRDIR